MIPYICQNKHDPDSGTYGDCVRACVASILELEPPEVPHFFDGGNDAVEGSQRLLEFLATRNLTAYFMNIPADTLKEALIELNDIHGHYMLLGTLENGGSHAVVCKASEVVHDPSWVKSPMVAPNKYGLWQAVIIAVA